MQAQSKRMALRLPAEALNAIDRWRGQQADVPSRPEAIRRLVGKALGDHAHAVRFSPGETLVITLLCDLHKALKVDSDVDTRVIHEAIAGGHFWGLKQAYPGLFHDEVDNPQDVGETIDILEMWSRLRGCLETLDAVRRDALSTAIEMAGGYSRFSGFDTNREPHYRIVRFLIDQLGRYTEFKELEINSRVPMLEHYRRMLRAYRGLSEDARGRALTEKEIQTVLEASIDPNRPGS